MSSHRHSSPQAIEQDIEQTRARLDRTIDALEDKLSPMHLVSQVLSFTKAGGGQFAGGLAGGLASTARNHPLPMTLLSLGAGWMMMAQRDNKSTDRSSADKAWEEKKVSGEWLREHGAEAKQKTHEMVEKTKDKAKEAMSTMQNQAHDLLDKAHIQGEEWRDQAAHLKDTVVSTTEQNIAWLQETAGKLMDDNPLAAGALMVAAGALLGGVIPVTEPERKFFAANGEKARGAAMKAMALGSEAVRDMAGAALEEGQHVIEDLAGAAKTKEPVAS